ncbi:MAG: PIN domain-containing protein [Deltaproteobacteria bacterium]|nr:PIN domain-containing protein [Deltaproteobacteria bacterium]
MILVDTSVWIATFRIQNPLDLDEVLDFDEIVTCLPVVQEVLQGFRDEGAFRRAREAMLALPIVESPLGEEIVSTAVDLYRGARRSGLTVRSSIDCLIAACAIRNDLEILHRDRDYPMLARVSPLRHRLL